MERFKLAIHANRNWGILTAVFIFVLGLSAMRMHALLFLLLMSWSSTAFSDQAPVTKATMLSQPQAALTQESYPPIALLPAGSRVGLLVETPANTPIAINSEQLFPPASTLKVLTALAAKLELGDTFRFHTQLAKQDDNLIFHFSGDPTLTSQDLDRLISELVKLGIQRVEGDIWLDNSAFSGYERAVGWPWDITGVCYSAPASAITLDRNCVQASIYTNADGTTRAHVPKHQPIDVITTVSTVSKALKKEMQCDLELLTKDNNRYQLSGCLVQRSKPLPLKFAVQETHLYTAAVIRRLLNKHNIQFGGRIGVNPTPDKAMIATQLIATHHSEPLPKLLDKMLKKSDNLIADTLTKTIGAHFYLQRGSFKNGTEAMKQIIYAETMVDLTQAQLVDGSGLSRNNRLSPVQMSQLLNYIWLHDDKLGLYSLLPKSGESGTLRYRSSMRKSPIKGRLQAKSGSVYASYNIAGYILGSDGQPKATFVQYVTDYFPPKPLDNQPQGPRPIYQFEQAFYNDLLTLSQD